MKQAVLIMILCFVFLNGKAQTGIGTTTPSASAKLEIYATNKGFLPPRIVLTAATDEITFPSPATGLLIYNTSTAGTSPNNVVPGYYYYDGSKWQRLINQQPDATVEFNQLTPTTSGVVFTPNTPASKDYVYVSTVDNSQWTYNGSSYVTYTPPASTPWYLSAGTSDAGSNKTSAIYRTGYVGIGIASPTTSLDVSGGGKFSGTLTGGNTATSTLSGFSANMNTQTGTTYTLLTSDNGKIITLNNASSITVTVPSLFAGFNCMLIQLGAGQITLTGSSTTITNRSGYTKSGGTNAIVTLIAVSATTFISSGDMSN